MHWLPYGARLDVRFVERPDQCVAREAECIFIDQETAKPIGVASVGGLGHERNAWKVGEGIAVAEGDGTSLLDTKIQDCKLAAANTCEHIAHAIVVPQFR